MSNAFEWDHAKSLANLAKHGIDFDTARNIWTDPRLLEVPARTINEPRWFVIGKLDDKFWSAVFARRNGVIRLISVRRSRTEEIEIYESAIES
jgi:uncharacterized protein